MRIRVYRLIRLWSHSISHNVTEQEKDEGDLHYLLHGASELTKKKVKLTEYQLMERMMVFLKYKSRNMLQFVKDPLSLLLLMTGNYIVDVKWIIEGRGKGLDLARFASLWALNLNPEDVTKRNLLNVFSPRNYYDGPDADDPDCVIEEEENPVQHVEKPGREYSPEEVADLFDNMQHLPRHSLVSAWDSNDEFEDPATTSKPSLLPQKLQGVESKLKSSFFDPEMEEDIDFGHGGDGGDGGAVESVEAAEAAEEVGVVWATESVESMEEVPETEKKAEPDSLVLGGESGKAGEAADAAEPTEAVGAVLTAEEAEAVGAVSSADSGSTGSTVSATKTTDEGVRTPLDCA